MAFAMFEFLIPQRPVSSQTRRRENLREWKTYVAGEASKVWPAENRPFEGDLRVTLVYLASDDPADVDNIIKPIQDALVGLVYEDDGSVCDVDSHRRLLTQPIDVTDLPALLQNGVAAGEECVYVRVSKAAELKEYL